MKKQLKQSTAFATVLTCFFVLPVCAQFSLGIQGGFNSNYLVTNTSSLVSTQYNSLYGFNASVPLVYQVEDWFAVKATPGFMQKNYQMARTGFYQGVYEDYSNGYVQLPVMAQFSFGGDALRGYVDLGGYAGYWLTGHVTGRMPNILNQPAYTNATSTAQPNDVFDEFTQYNYSEKYEFNSTRDKRMELGVLAGVGLSYQINDTYKAFAEATYYDGLTDLQKKYELGLVPRYNESYGFNIGVLYTIQ